MPPLLSVSTRRPALRAGLCRPWTIRRKDLQPWFPAGRSPSRPISARIRITASSGGTSPPNLTDASGNAYGAQWTLFRQALKPGAHATRMGQPADLDGPCGGDARETCIASAKPLHAAGSARPASMPIHSAPGSNSWEMRGLDGMDPRRDRAACVERSRGRISATRCGSMPTKAWCCRATPVTAANPSANRPRITTASRSSRRRAASPSTTSQIEVTGQAWMDREWSSQPLAPDQSGWDWLSLHLKTGEKLMLYRMRQTDGQPLLQRQLDLVRTASSRADRPVRHPDDAARVTTEIGTRKLADSVAHRNSGTGWRSNCTALNPQSWMGTCFSLLGRADRFHRHATPASATSR